MDNTLAELFSAEKIEFHSILPITSCNIINQNLFKRKTPFAKSVIVFLVPYYAGESENRNISLYAVSRNYHDYLDAMTNRVCDALKKKYPEAIFTGMGDHSPIAETNAAAAAGLGVIGDNYRLINNKYGSYVFIGEIFTDITTNRVAGTIHHCCHCGACKEACPSPNSCLSAVTQRKGELTKGEIELMKKHNTAWGCDICQMVCPHNKDIAITPIEFFKKDLIYRLTPEILRDMSEDELAGRAFGWRKRKTIERNIKLLQD